MLSSTLSLSFQSLARSALSKSATLAAVVGTQTRTFASVLPDAPTTSKDIVVSGSKPHTPEGHFRPHLGVNVDPNHGLYGFFRRIEKDGRVDYETVEIREHSRLGSSTSHLGLIYSEASELVVRNRPVMECC